MHRKRTFRTALTLAGLVSMLGCAQDNTQDSLVERSSEPANTLQESINEAPVTLAESSQDTSMWISNESEKQAKKVEEIVKNEYTVRIGSTGEDPPPVFSAFEKIYPVSEHAGTMAKVYIRADDRGKNAGIVTLKLYENGKQISSYNGVDRSIAVTDKIFPFNTPGTYTYQAEAIDIGGNRTKSETIDIAFTGAVMDPPPEIVEFSLDHKGGLNIEVHDTGDLEGLRRVEVVEDCKGKNLDYDEETVKSFKCTWRTEFSTRVPLSALNNGGTGTHKYHIRATDMRWGVSNSETITVHYKE